MASQKRPLSPFMLGQTYKFQITSVMSLMHRMTGVVLALSAFGFSWWIMSMALGGVYAECAAAVTGSLPGKVVLFLISLALMYHLFNGIRHLAWDAGLGFRIPQVYASGYAVLAATVVSTTLVWFLALSGGAA
ncbi:succinate dehydrogenase, cytochrome b556 subunit [Lysobacter pythonis]|uniref:Succinate dehydrogenase cytochrome b556 subunit n=1 Tax=Solilutibacter pythonis TaxID=2483112 RepID=A0A3M2I5R3_9GAMM|nr:succinate dehydrogenase, cytochrome b556 subunit [Lysobacter pythonis]RMH94879.1 succinate dehydrogenase, cytochrome b556 subunit [Lysobacter pythonis]